MCNKMSDVRLSNASPTLERGVDARPADALRPPVRRNLFGSRSPDRAQEIRRYLEATIQDDVREFMDHYNFDPVNERPLSPRNYEWEEDRDAAEFYRRPPHRRLEVRGEGEAAAPAADPAPEEEDNSSGSRKRRTDPSESCSDECPSKRSRRPEDPDEDDDEAPAKPAVTATGEGGAESSAEVH